MRNLNKGKLQMILEQRFKNFSNIYHTNEIV